MKLDAVLGAALLATTASAMGPENPVKPVRLKGKPAKMDDWRWPNPFASPRHAHFTPSCTAERAFPAQEFVLDDLAEHPPQGLLPYRPALRDVFSTREYPGSWDGIDPHGYDRRVLLMDYTDVPLAVREWIEQQERSDGPGKGLFALFRRPKEGYDALTTIQVPEEAPVSQEWRARDDGRVVLFAPGAVYEVGPLWVAEGSDCEETLSDLTKYSAELVNGGVVAYPVDHSQPERAKGKRDIEFKIKAQVLQRKEGEDAGNGIQEAAEAGETAEVTYSAADDAGGAGRDEL